MRPASPLRSAKPLVLRALLRFIKQGAVLDPFSPLDECCCTGFDLPLVTRTNEQRNQPDKQRMLTQPDGFRRLQASCKAGRFSGHLSALPLSLSAPGKLACWVTAKRLALAILWADADRQTAGSTLGGGNHFGGVCSIRKGAASAGGRRTLEARRSRSAKKEEGVIRVTSKQFIKWACPQG